MSSYYIHGIFLPLVQLVDHVCRFKRGCRCLRRWIWRVFKVSEQIHRNFPAVLRDIHTWVQIRNLNSGFFFNFFFIACLVFGNGQWVGESLMHLRFPEWRMVLNGEWFFWFEIFAQSSTYASFQIFNYTV